MCAYSAAGWSPAVLPTIPLLQCGVWHRLWGASLIVRTRRLVAAGLSEQAMRKIPGNSHFKARVEYTTIVEYYFGRAWYIASQIGLNGALMSLNIISVVQSAQVRGRSALPHLPYSVGGVACGLSAFAMLSSSRGRMLRVPLCPAQLEGSHAACPPFALLSSRGRMLLVPPLPCSVRGVACCVSPFSLLSSMVRMLLAPPLPCSAGGVACCLPPPCPAQFEGSHAA
jgi:hypothetical protein